MPTITERIIRCEQGSKEWFDARLGCLTSSRIADAIAKRKRIKKAKEGDPPEPVEELACRWDMRVELLLERLTGNATEHYVSRWMQEGKDKEPLALAEYEIRYGYSLDRVGFVYHPSIQFAGCSPDSLVGIDGLVEAKCPRVETHIGYIVADEIPEQYLPQLLWQLACCDDREWVDFISFSPDVPDKFQLFRKRLDRTEQAQAVIRGMELEAVAFLADVENLKAELERRSKGL